MGRRSTNWAFGDWFAPKPGYPSAGVAHRIIGIHGYVDDDIYLTGESDKSSIAISASNVQRLED